MRPANEVGWGAEPLLGASESCGNNSQKDRANEEEVSGVKRKETRTRAPEGIDVRSWIRRL
jgi:hypothetical protein